MSTPFRFMPFLTQSDFSVENGLFRLEPKSGFLTQSKRSFFDSLCFDRVFRLGDPVEKVTSSTGSASRKTRSKKIYTCFFDPSHLISPPNTHPTRPHTHTRYHSTVSYKALTLAWLSLLLLLAASQRGAFLAPLASSVYHTTAAARGIDPILPTTATPTAVALAALG